MARIPLPLAAIAARCGVSKATVSKALAPIAARYRIAPDTRERILAVVREFDAHGADSVGSRRGRIALLVRGEGHHWGSVNCQLMIGLITALQRRHTYDARIQLKWESASQYEQVVPQTQCILPGDLVPWRIRFGSL
jgi:Bacterial regulatory proteins, lacI family